MIKELVLEAPERLEATPGGRIAGGVRLANHDFSDWRCTCRLEAASGPDATFVFAADGTARLELPAETAGTLSAVLELAEPYGGARMIGALEMDVGPGGGEGPRQVAYRQLDGDGAGATTGARLDDKVMLRIPLVTERPSRAVALDELLKRERCMPLPNREGGARVVSVHAGASSVLGRCYASQLQGSTRDFLEQLGESAIDWVTLWDDRWVNKLSARLLYRLESRDQSLEIRNITDYSQARNEFRVLSSARDELRTPPGATVVLPLEPGVSFQIVVGEGDHRRELVSCRFVETRLGRLGVRVPFLKTERTRFSFPPESKEGIEISYLGVWLPLAPQRFAHLLELAEEPLPVAFPREKAYFWVRYRHGRSALTVSSNEDLREGLTR